MDQQALFLGLEAQEHCLTRFEAWLKDSNHTREEKQLKPQALLLFGDYTAHKAALQPLNQACKSAEIAFLLLDDAQLALEIEADGLLLSERRLFAQTRNVFNQQNNPPALGLFGGTNRHEAMLAGEDEPDYLFFGDLRAETCMSALADWWAELFEIPCVCAKSAKAEFKYTLLA